MSGEDSSELRGSKKKEAKRKESIKSYVFPCTLGRCYVVESRNPSPAYVRIVRWLCPRKGILEDGFVTEGCSTMAFFLRQVPRMAKLFLQASINFLTAAKKN